MEYIIINSSYDENMDAAKLLAILAICTAIVAVAVSCIALFSDQQPDESDSAQGNFTDAQIKELVGKLMINGGKIYTAQGNFDISSSRWSIEIEDRLLVCHSSTYNQDYYIPFASIDYIWVNG